MDMLFNTKRIYGYYTNTPTLLTIYEYHSV